MRIIKCIKNVRHNGKVVFTKGRKYEAGWTSAARVYSSMDDFGVERVIYNGGDIPLSWYQTYFASDFVDDDEEETDVQDDLNDAYDRAMGIL